MPPYTAGSLRSPVGIVSRFHRLSKPDAEGERKERPKARAEGGGKDLASAGERKASDRNGATESVACLSEASLQREQRNEGSE